MARLVSRGSPARRILASKGRRDGVALALLLLAQVLLVGHQVRGGPSGSRVDYWAALALSPLQHAAAWAVRTADGIWSTYVWQVGAARENASLGAEARQLKIENQRLRSELLAMEERIETDTFRSALQFDTLAAKVIGQSRDHAARELVVNRGADDGIRTGMAVLAPDGIVGRIVASYANSAMVMLLDDPDSGAGVELARSGARGVLYGIDDADCEIAYIRAGVPVALGEQVYSSGMDGVYPRGLPIGAVRSVKGGNGMHRISVQLSADMERLTEVAVVLQGEHGQLPLDVRSALDETLIVPPTGVGRIKQAMREALAQQQRRIGDLGRAPPDFSAVVASLSDSGRVPEAFSPNEE